MTTFLIIAYIAMGIIVGSCTGLRLLLKYDENDL